MEPQFFDIQEFTDHARRSLVSCPALDQEIPSAPDEPSPYSKVSALACDTVEAFRQGRLAQVSLVLHFAEMLLQSDREPMATLIATGYLEMIQHICTKPAELHEIYKLLGPECLQHCKSMDAFWGIE